MAQDFAKAFYKSKEWQKVREYVLRRDCYLCSKCEKPNDLEVHHIIHLTPLNINDVSISLNPENLITLCRSCHFKEHYSDKAKGHQKIQIDEEVQYGFDENGYLIELIPPGRK